MSDLNALEQKTLADISAASDEAALEAVRVAALGKSGSVSALLKTLGFTRGQVAGAVAWQSSAIAVVGLVIGLPVGVAAGRWLWLAFARELSAVPDPVVPAGSIALAAVAALVLAKRSLADRDGLPALAEIKAHATHSQEPQWFTTAPIPAIRKLFDKVGWSVGDVDLFEINEAFAVVAMAAQKDLGIPREKLNINGGACALGHPIGATGARLIVTLLHALEARNLKRGVAALCIGGGEATAVAVERVTA